MEGCYNNQLGERLGHLFDVMAQQDPGLTQIVSRNIHGPAWRNMLKRSKKLDQQIGLPIIDRTIEEIAIIAVKHYVDNFEKGAGCKYFVGGAFPNHHYIPFPENDDKEERKKLKLAAEAKITTISYQSTNNGMSPLFQLMAQPQTNNFSSDFNECAVAAVLLMESIL
eukprot:8695843-Ditylum_brightwellii.AAC.1